MDPTTTTQLQKDLNAAKQNYIDAQIALNMAMLAEENAHGNIIEARNYPTDKGHTIIFRLKKKPRHYD